MEPLMMPPGERLTPYGAAVLPPSPGARTIDGDDFEGEPRRIGQLRRLRVALIAVLAAIVVICLVLFTRYTDDHDEIHKVTPFPVPGVYSGQNEVNGVTVDLTVQLAWLSDHSLEFSFDMQSPAHVHCESGNSLVRGPRGGADLTLGPCVAHEFKTQGIDLVGFAVANPKMIEFSFRTVNWKEKGPAIAVIVPVALRLERNTDPLEKKDGVDEDNNDSENKGNEPRR